MTRYIVRVDIGPPQHGVGQRHALAGNSKFGERVTSTIAMTYSVTSRAWYAHYELESGSARFRVV